VLPCAALYSNYDARMMSRGSGIFCDDRYCRLWLDGWCLLAPSVNLACAQLRWIPVRLDQMWVCEGLGRFAVTSWTGSGN
jgi:hypothetical protein